MNSKPLDSVGVRAGRCGLLAEEPVGIGRHHAHAAACQEHLAVQVIPAGIARADPAERGDRFDVGTAVIGAFAERARENGDGGAPGRGDTGPRGQVEAG